MSEQKFSVGNRVRHNSTKEAPAMVVVQIENKPNIFGNVHCRYWLNGSFVIQSFLPEELNLLAQVQS